MTGATQFGEPGAFPARDADRRVLRLGLATAGATAVFTVLLALGSPQSTPLVSIEDTFAAPEPEAYLALQ